MEITIVEMEPIFTLAWHFYLYSEGSIRNGQIYFILFFKIFHLFI